MSRANLCDSCDKVLPSDGEWYVLGKREPKPLMESMFSFLEQKREPQVLEFCTTLCAITYLMAAKEVVRDE